MPQAGDVVFVQMWPVEGHYEAKGYHAKLPEAQGAIYEMFPVALRPHLFWNNDGTICRLLVNTPFPYLLPFVKRVELV